MALLARGRAGLEAARRDVEAAGGEAMICQVDLARSGDVEVASVLVDDAFGPVDIWVNNAMVSVFSPIAQMTAEEYERVTRRG